MTAVTRLARRSASAWVAPARSIRGRSWSRSRSGGVTVSRATLHNEEDINRKQIREGDDVIVQRAGDVIPQIVGPAGPHRRGTKEFRMPTHCPLCGTEIVKPEGEAMHRCPNRACPSRGLETLINWTGVADIDGVGEQTIRVLWEKGLVRSLPDLYRLTKEQLLELDGFARDLGERSDRVDRGAPKQVPFSRVLLGLNIPGIGWVLAQQPRAPLRDGRSPDRRGAGGGRRGRGLRLRPRRGRRRMVRRRAEPRARRGAPRARAPLRARARTSGRARGR